MDPVPIVVGVWATLLVIVLTWIKLARKSWARRIEALGLRVSKQRPLLASGHWGALPAFIGVFSVSTRHGDVCHDLQSSTGTRTLTYYRVQGAGPYRVVLAAKDLGNAIATSRVGLKELQTANPEFNARFHLCAQNGGANLFGNPELQQRLVAMHDRDRRGLGRLEEIALIDGTVSVLLHGTEHSAQVMREALDVASSLARATGALCQTG